MTHTEWTRADFDGAPWEGRFAEIDSEAALARIKGTVVRTPILDLPSPDGLRIAGKMENRQRTNSFKSRGAFNNVLLLTDEERARGVVASSSGNHGRALAWAANNAGVAATIVMPKDAYPNKIQACRDENAEVVLAEDRIVADEVAESLANEGRVWVHPYDRLGTIEGAGTVGLEVARDAEALHVFVACIGGGGLSSGSALALRRALGSNVVVIGAEPVGAAAMTAAMHAGKSVRIDEITSAVQGLTTPFAGNHNVEVCRATLDGIRTVTDDAVYAAQRRLVRDDDSIGWTGEVVEPAGAAAYAVTLDPGFPEYARSLAERRGIDVAGGPLRVCVTISGGNPDPRQLEELRS